MEMKIGYMFLALIAVVAGVTTYRATTKAEKLEKRINTIVGQVNTLYRDETQDFLVSNVNEESFKIINELIEAEEGTKLTEELAGKLNTVIMNVSTARQMYEAETAVNNLLDESGVLNIDVDINNVIEKVSDLEGIKPVFVEAQRETINIASEQQDVINTTSEKINLLFNEDGTVKEEVTRAELEEIQLLHVEIKQMATREMLQAKLIAIDEKVVAKEVAAEEARRAEGAKAQANNSVDNSNSSNGSQSSGNNSTNNSSSSSSSNNSSNNKSSNNSGNNPSGGSSSSGGNGSNTNGGSGSSWDRYTPGDSWDCDVTGGGSITGNQGGNTWLGGTCGPM